MRRRFSLFATLMLGIAFLAATAVSLTWIHFAGVRGPQWLWWAFPVVLTGGFVPALLLGFRYSHPVLRAATFVSAIAVGFLTFFLMAALLSWTAAAFVREAAEQREAALWFYGAAAIVGVAGLINSVVPRSRTLRVPLAGLPPAWRGRTVALVTDVHLGNIRGAAFVRHLVWRLQRRRPHAVFISGDMFDGTRLDVDRAAAGWAALRPPGGVFFVTGNHDDRSARGEYLAALERAGIRVLQNEKVVVEGLQIVGVHDAETRSPRGYREILRRAAIDPAQASVLLAHQPRNLDVAEAAGIALQLSGHTHAGQFFPWSLIARRVHGKYVYGLNRRGRMWIYTSSGAGTWGPPFRLGTRSEIVFLKLELGAS